MRALLGIAAAAVTVCLGTGAAAAAVPAGSPAQVLASLDRPAVALTRPAYGAAVTEVVPRRRPMSGVVTTLPVIATSVDARGRSWLQVLLPGRPNGHSGWIRKLGTHPASTRWQLRVRRSTRVVTALRDGRVVRTFTGIVGAAATPTPTGRFFVEENVKLHPWEAGTPFALALSARSNVLDQFAGGPGQIALHGVGNIGGVLGAAASHGCVRLSTQAIVWLAARIRSGTRVTIVP